MYFNAFEQAKSVRNIQIHLFEACAFPEEDADQIKSMGLAGLLYEAHALMYATDAHHQQLVRRPKHLSMSTAACYY